MKSSIVMRSMVVSNICVAFLVCLTSDGSATAQTPGLQEIVETLRTRQQKFQSIHIVWKQTTTYAKNSIRRPSVGDPAGPPEDTAVEGSNRLWLDGSKYRIADGCPVWDPPNGRFVTRDDVFTFGGKVCKTYLPPTPKVAGSGMVNDENELLGTGNLEPLAWGFRGDDMFHRAPVEKWSVSRARSDRGVDCIVLANAADDRSAWFAAKQGFPLVRTELRAGGKIAYKFDIETKNDPQWGWVPTGWKYAEIVAGHLREARTATVTDLAVNVPVKPKLFDIDFPPGTDVYNSITEAHYMVQQGGGKTLIGQGTTLAPKKP